MTSHIRVPLIAAALALGLTALPTISKAQDTPLLGQMTAFATDYCPRGWVMAEGQLMAISQNTALFSILGTTFGGDGRTTFAIPDLRSRRSVGVGTGPGLAPVAWGEKGGQETVNLTVQTMGAHNHLFNTVAAQANQRGPEGDFLAQGIQESDMTDVTIYSNAAPDRVFNQRMIGATGGSQSHDNVSPVLAVTWCVATQGVFPSRQ